ncbi:hypothetical protein Sjap_017857 [Stephania japonica]|uniref:Uncharacterized protein n=1 Tax=Stephania japonica TaxID=461633 RepID=A0AAP0I6Z7_9MAGN
MAALLTTEPLERQRLYPMLHEGNDRQGFASTKRQAGQSSGAVQEQRHTGVRDEGDQFDRRRQDQQGRRDRHPGQQRGDEGHVMERSEVGEDNLRLGGDDSGRLTLKLRVMASYRRSYVVFNGWEVGVNGTWYECYKQGINHDWFYFDHFTIKEEAVEAIKQYYHGQYKGKVKVSSQKTLEKTFSLLNDIPHPPNPTMKWIEDYGELVINSPPRSPSEE